LFTKIVTIDQPNTAYVVEFDNFFAVAYNTHSSVKINNLDGRY